MANNQVVAVWGSPGSGKTLTSVKLAQELANKKKNVILVLSDNETPMVPLLVPSATNEKSLGDLLSQPALTPMNLFQHCIPLSNTLSVLGYQISENESTYSEYDADRAREFISLLHHTNADFVVIDCSHHLLSNTLTGVALEESDVVLKVVNADPKSLIYIRSQQPYLKEARFHYDQQINIINNLLISQDKHTYEDAFGGKAYILPHIPALKAQFDEARLLESMAGREAKLYEPALQTIIKEVIDNE